MKNLQTCPNCGKQHSNPVFCSRSCAASFNNKAYPKRKKGRNFKFTCSVCGKPSKYEVTMCLNCIKKSKENDTLQDIIYTKHHLSSAFALVRSRARYKTLNRPQVCELCGYDKHVEVHHIKPIHEFKKTALISEINADSNLVLLCPNCH